MEQRACQQESDKQVLVNYQQRRVVRIAAEFFLFFSPLKWSSAPARSVKE
jgi:hypothetical protein